MGMEETLEARDLITGTVNHIIQLTREKRQQTDYLPGVDISQQTLRIKITTHQDYHYNTLFTKLNLIWHKVTFTTSSIRTDPI